MLDPCLTALLGLVIGGLIMTRYFVQRKTSKIPICNYPRDKSENFNSIKKDMFYRKNIEVTEVGDENCRQHYTTCFELLQERLWWDPPENSIDEWFYSLQCYSFCCSYWLWNYRKSIQEKGIFITCTRKFSKK